MRRLLVVWLLLAGTAMAHEVQVNTAGATATVVTLRYADAQPFAFEAYELYPAGSETPAQVGRTDVAGRVVFIADTPGEWRLKAWSEDGHGVDRQISAISGELAVTPPLAETPRTALWLGGLGAIFGLFGLWQFYLGRKKR